MADVCVRKNYHALDLAKFICALTIISSHFASEWGHFPQIVDYAFSIYVIACPFFFCCSGFLFFNKLKSLATKEQKKEYFIHYEKRIWIMYGCWTLVYLPFLVLSWKMQGVLNIDTILRYLHKCLVIQTYPTIWFLPALAVGVAIVYFLHTRISKKSLIAIAVVLYVFGMFGYTYNFAIANTPIQEFYDVYNNLFFTVRNGVFNATPFIIMAYSISEGYNPRETKKSVKYFIGSVIFLFLMVAESFILKMKFNVTGMDIGVFLVPLTYFLMKWCLSLNLKDSKIYLWLRKLSVLIFVSQRLFLTALPTVFYGVFERIYANSYIGLFAVIAFTVIFSIVLIVLSKKIKVLKYFM